MTEDKLDKHLKNLIFFAHHCFAAATQEQKEIITQLAKQSYIDFGIRVKDFKLGCPDGWTPCVDGSCVPPGELCLP
jgi:hypothetical protein